MNRAAVPVLLTLLLAFSSGGLSAQTCPAPPSGPFGGGGWAWTTYTPASSCWSPSGNVSAATLSCGGNGYEFGQGNGNKITYTFTIGQNDPIFQTWSADAFIEFNDPNDSWWNQVHINAQVVHNGVTSYYNLFYHNGTMGDLNGCSRQGGNFSATYGDTVTIEILAHKWYSNTTIKTLSASIFTTNP